MEQTPEVRKGRGAAEDLAVVLPVSPSAFGEFIAGLLGKPQTIERLVEGPFAITREKIEGLYHLVTQRVSQQNQATLIEFSSVISYDDGSSVRLNSFSEFETYTEIRTRVSDAITLTWIYLVDFPNHGAPEKQEITLTFRSGYGVDVDSYGLPLRAESLQYRGGFSIRINHTVRSWGVDMESLLANHLATLRVVDKRPLRKWIGRYNTAMGMIAAAALLTSAIVSLSIVSADIARSRLSWLEGQVMGLQQGEANTKVIEILSRSILGGEIFNYNLYFAVFVIVVLILAVVVGVIVGMTCSYNHPNFLLLTNEARQAYDAFLGGERWRGARVVASMVGAVLIGVASNYVFGFLVSLGTKMG